MNTPIHPAFDTRIWSLKAEHTSALRRPSAGMEPSFRQGDLVHVVVRERVHSTTGKRLYYQAVALDSHGVAVVSYFSATAFTWEAARSHALMLACSIAPSRIAELSLEGAVA